MPPESAGQFKVGRARYLFRIWWLFGGEVLKSLVGV